MKRLMVLPCAVAVLLPSLAFAGNWDNHRHYSGPRYNYGYYGGGHCGNDLLAGIVIGGLTYWVLDTITDAQRPVVAYQQPQPQVVYQPTYIPQNYAQHSCQPLPSNTSPQCRKYVGYPDYLAACERGAAEFQEEERRRLEREAYEAGRKGLPQ